MSPPEALDSPIAFPPTWCRCDQVLPTRPYEAFPRDHRFDSFVNHSQIRRGSYQMTVVLSAKRDRLLTPDRAFSDWAIPGAAQASKVRPRSPIAFVPPILCLIPLPRKAVEVGDGQRC